MSVVLWVWLACATGAIAPGTVRLWRRLSPRMFLRLAVPPVALAATLACAIAPLERRSWMADLTEDRRNSLSSLSKKVIGQADQDVRISAFFVPNRPGWERPTTLIKGYGAVLRLTRQGDPHSASSRDTESGESAKVPNSTRCSEDCREAICGPGPSPWPRP